MRTSSRFRLAAAAVGAAAALVSSGLSADPLEAVGGDALEMSADRLEIDVEARTAVLSGSVSLTKGAMAVRCPRVDLRYDHVPHVTWAKGSGGVVAEVKGVRGEAPEVELDLVKQTLDLRGGVKLTHGGGWLTAERATIHIATAKVTLTEVKGSVPVGKAGK